VVEAWLDSLDSGTKIAQCTISSTGSWTTDQAFAANVLVPVSGMHDLHLRFRGAGTSSLFMLRWLTFLDESGQATSVGELRSGQLPGSFALAQNYPNPFNPETVIRYQLAAGCMVHMDVYDLLGRQVATLVNDDEPAGYHSVQLSALSARQSSGCYYYRLRAGDFVQTKKMTVIK
jgi:xylan 1,4-beta-xylosidase